MRQAQALSVMMAGESVFLTGSPGAGKTYVLNRFISLAKKEGKNVAVTASTGIAATHIGGTTIHSWTGLGIRDELSERDEVWLKDNDRLSKRYNSTDILVIDEVSMLHGKRLDMVSQACKLLRENDAPFGGLQVILVGDLFQLPPVTRGEDAIDFAHLSDAWEELNPKICYLTEQHRQTGGGLLEVLQAMRDGEVEEVHHDILAQRLGEQPEENRAVTRLYAHNVDVESINQQKLHELTTDTKVFTMLTKGSSAKIEQLTRSLLSPEILELKIGAEVMFVANNFSEGYVNGTRGVVVDFKDNSPLVQLLGSGRIITVEPYSWVLEEDGKKRAEAAQLPLRLAWAITIHKSQGMSLDSAEIDLSRSFTPGMGYVALSRVRSIEGVYLNGMNAMALELHPDIYEFDSNLKSASSSLSNTTEDYVLAKKEKKTTSSTGGGAPKTYDIKLFNRLKKWRYARAQKDSVPAYIIAHDSLLESVAQKMPASKKELHGLSGMGPAKLEKYGDELLAVVGEFANTSV